MGGKTRRLYFEDPYQVDFEARVVKNFFHEGHPALVLDQTCFYPEGGGQPADRGTIEGIPVLHVLEQDDRIIHVLENEVAAEKVKGRIDWTVRFDHMQQHAGQHVLSQCFVQLYDAATRSFHLGETTSTLEVDMRNIDEEEAARAEKLANDIVFQNREIRSHFYAEEEIADVRLRRPSKKAGEIRVIDVSDFDRTACGGTHPHRTGEIGVIKILRWDRIRNNVRLEFICGTRALDDYSRKHRDLRSLSNILTVDDREIVKSFEKFVSDLKVQKKANRRILENLIQYEAMELMQKAEGNIIKKIFMDRPLEEGRLLALTIIKKGEFFVLFGLKSEERVHVFLARSDSFDKDLRDLLPVISPLIEGKGGGRPSLVEISGRNKVNLEQALDTASRHIRERL